MNSAEIEKEIRERWFKDHIATVKEEGNLKTLVWAKPGTGYCRIRYVMDGGMLYISGDLGDAMFRLTWNSAAINSYDISLGYFTEKLVAYSGKKYDFDSEEAVKELREWLKRLKEDECKYDHERMRDLFSLARECDNIEQWGWRLQEHSDFLSSVDIDYWEWIGSIGRVTPPRIRAYLIGLQMAAEQLERKKANE